jgi:acetolactate synthase I/II/III large subunit
MVRVADYIINFFEKRGIKFAFEVTGGGAMFLNDAVEQSNITPIFCHHEQACAMAAVGYSKTNNEVSLLIPTTGCGSTNTITGILDAWQDSNKIIVISGQVNKKDTTYLKDIPLRKLGVQEANIIDIVKSITKYATMIQNPNDIAYELEKAYDMCINGRSGPVWLDVPLDIQSSLIDENNLHHYSPNKQDLNPTSLQEIEKYLQNSKRPIIIAGNGVYLSDCKHEFIKFIEKYQIPTAVTFGGIGLLEENHPLYVGRLGIKGTRAGNFAVANSDLIISLGSSLSIPVTGYQYHLFGRESKIVVVDIDENEHLKNTVKIEKIIKDDLSNFFSQKSNSSIVVNPNWIKKCIEWKNKWSPFDRDNINELNMYSFSKKLSESTQNLDSLVVTDAGSAYYVLAQSLLNNKLILPLAQGEMGFMLPAAIGASIAQPNTNIIGVTGEGSFQFNIQELQTIIQNNLPIKIFILNNGGYLSIRNTQTKFFEKRFSGVDKNSGVSFPDTEKIAYAYGFPFMRVNNIDELDNINQVINHNGYYICEIMCPLNEEIYPTSATLQTNDGKLVSQPLENMSPFLSKEEFESEMIIPIFTI